MIIEIPCFRFHLWLEPCSELAVKHQPLKKKQGDSRGSRNKIRSSPFPSIKKWFREPGAIYSIYSIYVKLQGVFAAPPPIRTVKVSPGCCIRRTRDFARRPPHVRGGWDAFGTRHLDPWIHLSSRCNTTGFGEEFSGFMTSSWFHSFTFDAWKNLIGLGVAQHGISTLSNKQCVCVCIMCSCTMQIFMAITQAPAQHCSAF